MLNRLNTRRGLDNVRGRYVDEVEKRLYYVCEDDTYWYCVKTISEYTGFPNFTYIQIRLPKRVVGRLKKC